MKQRKIKTVSSTFLHVCELMVSQQVALLNVIKPQTCTSYGSVRRFKGRREVPLVYLNLCTSGSLRNPGALSQRGNEEEKEESFLSIT